MNVLAAETNHIFYVSADSNSGLSCKIQYIVLRYFFTAVWFLEDLVGRDLKKELYFLDYKAIVLIFRMRITLCTAGSGVALDSEYDALARRGRRSKIRIIEIQPRGYQVPLWSTVPFTRRIRRYNNNMPLMHQINCSRMVWVANRNPNQFTT